MRKKKKRGERQQSVHGDPTEAGSGVRLNTGRHERLTVQWALAADSQRWKDPAVFDDNHKM